MSWQASLFNLLLRVTCKHRLHNCSLSTARRRLDRLLQHASRFSMVPSSVARQRVDVGGVPCEWVTAHDARSAHGVLVYFHGGAFMSGSPRTHIDVAWRMSAACRRRVLMVDYRLTPQHAFPAALDDTLAVYGALCGSAHGSMPIAFAGDSAGANLALATISRLKDADQPLPDGCICFSPWVDLTLSAKSVENNRAREAMLPLGLLVEAARAYAGSHALDDPRISPLHARFDGFPPLLIYASSSELLLDDARRLASRALSAGVSVKLCIWPNQSHAFPTIGAFVPEARTAIEEIGRFTISKLGGPRRSRSSRSDAFAKLHFEHATQIESWHE
jgi:acetyl esterase/lipase